ncbi:unnamed protein product, partial [Mesorhabditis spiculigera]
MNNKLQMTSIHSAKEQAKFLQKVRQLANCDYAQLGMANVRTGSKYRSVWRDSSPVDYTHWQYNEPSFRIPPEYTNNVVVPENCTVACTLTCTQNKLQLTTIHSAKEQAKLSQKIAQLAKCASVMIGMANVIAGTRYRNIWRDGSAVDYTYWANGEPSYIIPHEYTAQTVPENCTVARKWRKMADGTT